MSKININLREIVEDIVDDVDNDIVDTADKRIFTDSGGLTGSASIGLDPSVDSVVLQDFDYIEPIEKVSQS